MIVPHKEYWGLPDILRLYGSTFTRSLLLAGVGTLITLLLELTVKQSTAQRWFSGFVVGARGPSPFPFQLFAFIVGFGLTFRSTFAYRRYWEGRTQLQVMTTFFTESVIQTLNFDRGTIPKNATPEQIEKANKFGETYLHYMSLLHAMAMATLRRDANIHNLTEHNGEDGPPPADAGQLREKTRQMIAEKKRQVRRELKEKPLQGRRFLGLSRWFYPRHLYHFKGNFGFSDLFMLRSKPKMMQGYNDLMPLPVIGGLSVEEKEALGSEMPEAWPSDDSRGIRLSTGVVIPGPAERVGVIVSWVNQIILDRRREGGLAISPPIMTRVYGVLSGGMAAYEQCRKLMDTPFPFPAAQLVSGVLMMFLVMLPFVVAASIKTLWLALLITFISTLTHYGLNELARDLEDPFVYDPNDLPLSRLQYNFNERVLSAGRTKRPITTTELGVARLRTLARKDTEDAPRTALPAIEEEEKRVGGRTSVLEDVLGIELNRMGDTPSGE